MGMERTQESMICIDTHVVLWLYDKDLHFLSDRSKKMLQDSQVYITAIVILELQYLYEVGRSKYSPHTIIGELSETLGLKVLDTPFHTVIQYAVQNTWTRDPFDRVIVADAQARNVPLITADKIIQKYYSKALV